VRSLSWCTSIGPRKRSCHQLLPMLDCPNCFDASKNTPREPHRDSRGPKVAGVFEAQFSAVSLSSAEN
jgi:hypothetical protein